jgi:hypothetical protein
LDKLPLQATDGLRVVKLDTNLTNQHGFALQQQKQRVLTYLGIVRDIAKKFMPVDASPEPEHRCIELEQIFHLGLERQLGIWEKA